MYRRSGGAFFVAKQRETSQKPAKKPRGSAGGPCITNEKLKRHCAGQVVLQLKSPCQTGSTPIVMSPLEFMQRLAALVPHPRLHPIRFHGVLAPHATLRAAIVPSPAHQTTERAADHAHAYRSAPARMSWARMLKQVFDIDIQHCSRVRGAGDIVTFGEKVRSNSCSRKSDLK